MKAYHELEEHFAKMSDLAGALAILNWDRAVMMPSGSAHTRARQQAALQGVLHDMLCGEKLPALLDAAEGGRDRLSPWQKANLRHMRRAWIRSAALPSGLVAQKASLSATCESVWRAAKPRNDFAAVRPLLEELLVLVREEAVIKGDALGLAPYDALIDQYDPGNTAANITGVFDSLAQFLPGFINAVTERQEQEGEPLWLKGRFPVPEQRLLAEKMAALLGFDFDRGRIDVSAHPFSGGVQEDKRITTRYLEDDFLWGFKSVLHETGHALFDMHTPQEWHAQPVGDSFNMGMAIHESQSLLFDMIVGRSPAFARFAAPLFREAFGASGPAWEEGNIARILKWVERGFIRVDADEVTYPAHVILRFRLEKALIGGDLQVKDLPDAWAEGMKALLGVTPPDHARGCMQDIHWYEGWFGYFPAYALGEMTAAQLYDTALRQLPGLEEDIAAGNFRPLTGWLKKKIHSQGCLHTPQELVFQVTGQPLNPEIFKNHLRRRYLGLETADAGDGLALDLASSSASARG